jgi:hypothetical protein
MKEKFKQLLMKKKMEGKMLNPEQAKAKMDVLEELMGLAEEGMGDKLRGLKKVTVAAPDKEGLKEGLEKAENILESSEEMSDEDEEEASEEEKSPEDEIMALEAKLAELKAKSKK